MVSCWEAAMAGWVYAQQKATLRGPLLCSVLDIAQTITQSESETAFPLEVFFTLMPCGLKINSRPKIKGWMPIMCQ